MESHSDRHRGTLDGATLAMGERLQAVAHDADGTQHGHTATSDGGMWLHVRVSAADWAVLAPLVAARAELGDLPLVSQLDDAGLRDCLRDAAVASVGGE